MGPLSKHLSSEAIKRNGLYKFLEVLALNLLRQVVVPLKFNIRLKSYCQMYIPLMIYSVCGGL